MARAKRTRRADARRRHRQATAAEWNAESAEADAIAAEAVAIHEAARSDRPRSAPANPSEVDPPPARASIGTAFRQSFQPADVRGDLRALPWLVLRTRAVVIPGLLIGITGLAALVLGAQGEFFVVLAFQAFLVPPPLAASFLGGILAPRAAWLVGGIVGLLSAVIFSIVILVAPDDTLRGLFRASGEVPAGFRQQYVIQAFLTAPLLGLAVGAFSGFYRRFLRASNPGRGQRHAVARR